MTERDESTGTPGSPQAAGVAEERPFPRWRRRAEGAVGQEAGTAQARQAPARPDPWMEAAEERLDELGEAIQGLRRDNQSLRAELAAARAQIEAEAREAGRRFDAKVEQGSTRVGAAHQAMQADLAALTALVREGLPRIKAAVEAQSRGVLADFEAAAEKALSRLEATVAEDLRVIAKRAEQAAAKIRGEAERAMLEEGRRGEAAARIANELRQSLEQADGLPAVVERLVEDARQSVWRELDKLERTLDVIEIGPNAPAVAIADQVDLNRAGFAELRALGMTRTQAARVIRAREAAGGFDSLDALDRIPGFRHELREKLRARLMLGPAGAA